MTMYFIIFWAIVPLTPIQKSTLHSLITTAYSLGYIDVSSYVISSFSVGYYLIDLCRGLNWIYTIHHIFSVVECVLLLDEPYQSHNMFRSLMIVEGSVPFLNMYLAYNKLFLLVIYLCSHVYFRNIMLYLIYVNKVPSLLNHGMSYYQVFAFQFFIIFNFYWTYTTAKKIKNKLLM